MQYQKPNRASIRVIFNASSCSDFLEPPSPYRLKEEAPERKIIQMQKKPAVHLKPNTAIQVLFRSESCNYFYAITAFQPTCLNSCEFFYQDFVKNGTVMSLESNTTARDSRFKYPAEFTRLYFHPFLVNFLIRPT